MNPVILKLKVYDNGEESVIAGYEFARDGKPVYDLEALQHGFVVTPEDAPYIHQLVQHLALAGVKMSVAEETEEQDPGQN